MTNLTVDQIRQLNIYSVYIDKPEHALFSLKDLLSPSKTKEAILLAQTVSKSPNKTVAASYFMRRFGMFTAMQLYNLAAYDEVWKGSPEGITFGAIEEYGNLAVSTFANDSDWTDVGDDERVAVIRQVLVDSDTVIQQIRTVANVSTLTLWENVFGFLLWQYHVLIDNPATKEEAYTDLETLKDDSLWEGIASRSLFANYLKGNEPSALLNTVVRKTCCLSKDVPGLIQCGFCPLK